MELFTWVWSTPESYWRSLKVHPLLTITLTILVFGLICLSIWGIAYLTAAGNIAASAGSSVPDVILSGSNQGQVTGVNYGSVTQNNYYRASRFGTTSVVALGDSINLDNLATLYVVPPLPVLKNKNLQYDKSQQVALTFAKSTSHSWKLPASAPTATWTSPHNSSTDNVGFVTVSVTPEGMVGTAFLAEPGKTYDFTLNISDAHEIKVKDRIFSIELQGSRLTGIAPDRYYEYTFHISEK